MMCDATCLEICHPNVVQNHVLTILYCKTLPDSTASFTTRAGQTTSSIQRYLGPG